MKIYSIVINQDSEVCLNELSEEGYHAYDTGDRSMRYMAREGSFSPWSEAAPLLDILSHLFNVKLLEDLPEGWDDKQFYFGIEEAISAEFSSSWCEQLLNPPIGDDPDFWATRGTNWGGWSEWVDLPTLADRLQVIGQLGRGAGTYPEEGAADA